MAKGRRGKSAAACGKKAANANSTKSIDAGEETSCGLCCKVVKDEDNESLILCEGLCGQWFHRYCAGVTTIQFEQLSNSEEPFFCYACFQQAYRAKVASLEDKITSLVVELEELKGAYRDRERKLNPQTEKEPQWSQVVKRGRRQNSHPPSVATTTVQMHSTSSHSGGTTNGSSRQHPPSRRKKEGIPISGARRIWRTHDSTTTRAVRKAIANLTSVPVDDLKIKRKYKTAGNDPSSTAAKRVIRWWFVVRANEKILQQLDGDWHKVALQTDWELTPLLQYVNSQGQSNSTQENDGTPQNSTNDPESPNEPPPTTDESIEQNRTSDSPQQQMLSQPNNLKLLV